MGISAFCRSRFPGLGGGAASDRISLRGFDHDDEHDEINDEISYMTDFGDENPANLNAHDELYDGTMKALERCRILLNEIDMKILVELELILDKKFC